MQREQRLSILLDTRQADKKNLKSIIYERYWVSVGARQLQRGFTQNQYAGRRGSRTDMPQLIPIRSAMKITKSDPERLYTTTRLPFLSSDGSNTVSRTYYVYLATSATDCLRRGGNGIQYERRRPSLRKASYVRTEIGRAHV